MQPTILFEDGHLIVLDKPAGIVVERDRFGYPSLEQWVRDYFNTLRLPSNAILGIVHRIDRPVSGVVVMAKKKSVLVHLNAQFASGNTSKTYYAIVTGAPAADHMQLHHYLLKDLQLKRATVMPKATKKTAEVKLDYRVLRREQPYTLLEVHPHSGKYHQIRAQLGAAGLPIVGDSLYGSQIKYRPDAIMLHAGALTFVHPVSMETMTIEAPVPADWPIRWPT